MNNKKIFKYKRIYFISFFLLFMFSLHIFATDAEEKITLSFTNQPLSEAIKKIEAVSDHTFFYDVNKTDLQQIF